MRALAQRDLHRLSLATLNPRVIRLGKVVVVARHPEHGHHRHAAFSLQSLRQRDRRQRLVNGVERPREEHGLLPRGHGEHVARREAVAAGPGDHRREYVRVHPARLAGRNLASGHRKRGRQDA